jgi:ABC-type sugar transport system substrate-binding protein
MKNRPVRIRWILATAFALLAGGAQASNNKIALIPGGPHPYFAPWEQAAADAKKDFGIAAVDFKVPSEWKLNLQTELIESLMTQGYNGFGIFPGDAVGINSTIDELAANKAPAIALAGCAQDPTKAAFCLGTDVFNSAYLGTKALIKAMGGKGKIVHLAGLLVDPNTKLRMDAVEKGGEGDKRRGDFDPASHRHRSAGGRGSEDQCASRSAKGSDRWDGRDGLYSIGRRREIASQPGRQAD